ncbi:MAG TPA: hypothetical protein PKD64_19410 [Pirellulaceae bacterium]|nr:hypothetical protein [Pirellulaceae bacterium]HMO94360.1 hypothetical protein [Pirellulaceae bacterium]HMP70392.1 hypothetical protein [Pirellulaceae bacterium]
MNIDKSRITAFLVELAVDDEQSLYVMLARDGSVHRMGRGTLDNDQHQMFEGVSDDCLFDSFIDELDASVLNYAGFYEDKDSQGQACCLRLNFHVEEPGEEIGFEFRYGAESQGPPTEICDLVINAIDLTEKWFENQIAMVNGSNR